VEEGVRVSDPVIVQTANPLDLRPEELDGLITTLRDEGLDARRKYLEQKGFGVTWWEVVLFWLAARTGEAVVNQVVGDAVEWMKDRFRQHPESNRPKCAIIILYEGDEGQASEVIELPSADAEPVRRPAHEFERYTRTRPPEV
jgi:hypothetical protein